MRGKIRILYKKSLKPHKILLIFSLNKQMLPILLTCLFLVANAGNISPHDIILSPNNIDSPSNITFIFTLDSSLAPTDYMRIVLPFSLDSIQSARWDTYVNCSTIGPTKRASVAASTITGDSNIYFVQFYNDLLGNALASLKANVTYFLTIEATISATAAGIFDPIQIYTVSNNVGNWIVYDSNTVFGTVALADAYSDTIKVSVTIPSTQTNSQVLGATYTVYIDIQPTITIKNQARIDIQLTNSNFSLLSCLNVKYPTSNTPLLFPAFQHLSENAIRAIVSKEFSAANAAIYRFECLVQNPVIPDTSNIQIITRMGYANTIVESGLNNTENATSLTAVAATAILGAWDETYHQVQLGWGYSASSVSALSIFSLYKDASTTERWYQSVKTIFKPKADTTRTEKLQVTISTVNDTAFTILTGTIYHNLPDFSDTEKVTCSIVTQGTLTCTNVGQIQALQYFVSFRFNIPSTVTATSATDFGKVTVQTQADGTTLLPLSSTTLTNSAISTNVALVTTNGIIASSTTVSGLTTTPYVTNGQDIILTFSFNYFTNQAIPVTSTNEINMGIEFYTSQALQTSSSPTCTIGTLTQDTDIVITDCGVDQLTTSTTRLRFRIAEFLVITGGSPAATLFTATPKAGSVSFNSVQFGSDQFSSLTYVSENVFDYYAHWVQGFTSTSPSTSTASGSSPFFFNSLVYSNGGLANVQVGTTFFATDATNGNVGTDFPTLIRVTGYLAPGEQPNADRLLLFFNDLEPLDLDNPCFGPQGITCTYQANTIDNTQTDSLTEYSGSRYVAINTDLTQRFNIYIPVKTAANAASLGYFLASASSVNSQADSQSIYSTMFSKRVNVATMTATTFTVAAAGTTTPQLTIPANTLIGSTITTQLANIAAPYIVSTANAAANIGAAYGYCGNYNFLAATGFTLQPFYASTQTPEQLCVNIEYMNDANTTIYCQVCPVHSAMVNSTVSVTNIKMPQYTGADYTNLVYIASADTGNLQGAVRDQQTGVLSPHTIQNLSLAFVPETIKKGSRNVLVNLTFTLQSPLPATIQLNLAPVTPSTSLLITPITSVACAVGSITVSSCSVAGSGTQIQISATSQDTAWPPATHNIQFMVDADSTAASISADTTVNYQATIMVDGLQTLTAEAFNSSTSEYTVQDSTQDTIQLRNLTYFFGNQGARSIISFTFDLPNDTMLYSTQKIVFNLGDIAATNLLETPFCLIFNASDNQVSNDFTSCDVSDLTKLTLVPKDSVSGSFIIQLEPLVIPDPSLTTGISAQIVGVDGSTVIASTSSALALLTSTAKTAMVSNSVVVQRIYSNTGNVNEFTLKVTPSVEPISLFSDVYLYFPTYYADTLGYQNLWCTANNKTVSCFIVGPRLLKVTFFEDTIPVGSTLEIKIYGIITPHATIPAGDIFVGIGANETVFDLLEFGEFTDAASVSFTPNSLYVIGSNIVSHIVREKTDYSFTFTTDQSGITTGNILTIDFPDQYGVTLWGKPVPTIQLTKSANKTVSAIMQPTFLGSRFKATLPIDLDPLTSYTFTIKGIQNPDYPVCSMDRPMLTISPSSQNQATFRTAPNTWDTEAVNYVADTDLLTLNYFTADGQQVTTIEVPMGVYSPEIRITPPNGQPFLTDVTFSTNQTGVSILADTLTAAQGSLYLSFRVGASSSVPPRKIILDFNKTERSNTSIYSVTPRLEIIVLDNYETLPVGPIRIVRGGLSLPYFWDLATLGAVPFTKLKVDAPVVDALTSPLSLPGANTLIFGPSTPDVGFRFVLAEDAVTTDNPEFSLELGGQDSRSYKLDGTTVTVQIVEPDTNPPVLSSLEVTTIDSKPTKQMFSFQVDQMAGVYYHIAYEGNLTTTDCLRIRENYEIGTPFDPLSADQAQYGAFFVYNENKTYQFEVDNLLTAQSYSYILCPFNQLDILGDSINGTFTTDDNQAGSYVLAFIFAKPITRAQLTAIICVFSRNLELPNLK